VGDASTLGADVQIRLLGRPELMVGGRQCRPVVRTSALLALIALVVGIAVPPSRMVDQRGDDVPKLTAASAG
jgi:hypothetical protein